MCCINIHLTVNSVIEFSTRPNAQAIKIAFGQLKIPKQLARMASNNICQVANQW